MIEHPTRLAQRLAAAERVRIEFAGAVKFGGGNASMVFEELEEAADSRRLNGARVAVETLLETVNVALRIAN